MSINLKDNMTDQQMEVAREMFGGCVDHIDRKTALLKNFDNIDHAKIKDFANEVNQVVEVELNDIGDIKTMQDGSAYELCKTGWRKIRNKNK